MFRIMIIAIAGLLTLSGCDEDASTSKMVGKAELSLQLLDFTYQFTEKRHRYYHRRLFTESGGVGATIVRGKVCVQNGTDCADALVDYRIDASQTLEQKGHYVATSSDKDRITLHYWAEDDKGNKFELEKIVITDGQKVTVE